MMRHLKAAGFFQQLHILLWKNTILIRRQLLSLLVEISCPFLFIAIILVIRYFIDRVRYEDLVYNQPNDIFNLFIPPRSNFTREFIFFYPNATLVREIVEGAAQILARHNQDFTPILVPMNTTDVSSIDGDILEHMLAFVAFPSSYSQSLPKHVNYTIFTQEDSVYQYNINSIFPNPSDYLYNRAPQDICNDLTYFSIYNSFNAIKFAIDLQIIGLQSNTSKVNEIFNSLSTVQYYCPGYYQDETEGTFAFFIPILISTSFMFTVLVTVGDMVVEKSNKMKEYLKLMGIRSYILWLTWWIRSMIIFIILSAVITAFTKIRLEPNSGFIPYFVSKALLNSTNFGIVFLLMIVYSTQTSTFSLIISQFFKTPFNAKMVTLLFWVVTSINIYDFLKTSGLKYIFCMFPNPALVFALQVVFQYERSGYELTFENLFKNVYEEESLSLGLILCCMIGATLAYIPVIWYLEQIFPGEYGVRLPFYFLFTPSYWCQSEPSDDLEGSDLHTFERPGFEREPESLKGTVCIQNLSKIFRTYKLTRKAVDNLNINFYESQITGLLGFNGSGKTTTMFMLSGLYRPSSGTAKIMGFDIRSQIDKIRPLMGFCPQYDILYENMTVYEHLKLIALIKGFKGEELESEVKRILIYVGLKQDKDKRAKTLSGGMRRRLSVGMAFIGDSKVIILDEPTSGLDCFNRHNLWELIRNYKTGRTIILTTHFMEEADALSDRIAIMNHGTVSCCGSPFYLKHHYGVGYKIVLVKNKTFNRAEMERILVKHVGDDGFRIESDIAAEMRLSVRTNNMQSLSELLLEMDDIKATIGVESYGIGSPDIEEVFLKAGRSDKNEASDIKDHDQFFKNIDESVFNSFVKENKRKTGSKLFVQQLRALLKKRTVIFFRRYLLALTILFLPLAGELVISFALPPSSIIIDQIGGSVKQFGSRQLDINQYRANKMPYSVPANETRLNSIFNKFYASESTRIGEEHLRSKSTKLQRVNESDNINKMVFNERKKNLNVLLHDYYFGMEWSSDAFDAEDAPKMDITVYFSTLAYHSVGVVVNEVSNLLLAYASDDESLGKTSISTVNSPLPSNDSRYTGNDFLKYLGCFDILPLSLFNFCTSLIIAILSGFLVMPVTREKNNGSKDLQLISGTKRSTYWISNFVFDSVFCLVHITLFVSVILIAKELRNDNGSDVALIGQDHTIGYFSLILVLSSFSWIISAYCWSQFFANDVTACVILIIVLGIVSFLDVVLSFAHLFVHLNDKTMDFESPVSLVLYSLRIILAILFPNVLVKRELFDIKIRNSQYCIDSLNSIMKTTYQYNTDYGDFNEPGLGLFILIHFVQFALYLVTFITIEMCLANKNLFSQLFVGKGMFRGDKISNWIITKPLQCDEATKIESTRIKSANLRELCAREPLVVKDLHHSFEKSKKSVVAVNELNFGVPGNQCFGLLGTNGAGKSTTFKIITGELESTKGNVYIKGFNVRTEREKARQNLGYCGQNDMLPEYLSVKQTLDLYAQLRGLHAGSVKQVTDDIITIFDLAEFKNALVQNLSGGNKRKLSSAIAFLGRPAVVCLDEPSTGMDPAAKRFLWNIIKKARDLGMTILITSHSMAECEALCDKIGIMFSGELKCFGSIQSLKQKYGDGYSLAVKCQQTKDKNELKQLVDGLNDFIRANFPQAVLDEQQNDTLFYKLRLVSSMDESRELKLGEVFLLIEENKPRLGIESFSVSETTLEQVFLSLVKSNGLGKASLSEELAVINEADQKRENKRANIAKPAPRIVRKRANISARGEDDTYDTDITLVSYRQSEESYFDESRLSRDSLDEIKF